MSPELKTEDFFLLANSTPPNYSLPFPSSTIELNQTPYQPWVKMNSFSEPLLLNALDSYSCHYPVSEPYSTFSNESITHPSISINPTRSNDYVGTLFTPTHISTSDISLMPVMEDFPRVEPDFVSTLQTTSPIQSMGDYSKDYSETNYQEKIETSLRALDMIRIESRFYRDSFSLTQENIQEFTDEVGNYSTLKQQDLSGNTTSSHPVLSMHSVPTTGVNRMSSKKYQCLMCQKSFSRPSSLTTHIYSHTGEKPFRCPFDHCGRHFSVLSNLRRHTKIHNLKKS